MNCKKIGVLLSAYLDNELSGQERSFVETHLKTCPACSGELKKMMSVKKLFPKRQKAQLNPYFEEKLLARIDENRTPILLLDGFIRASGRAILAGAGICLVLTAFIVGPGQESSYDSLQSYVSSDIFTTGENAILAVDTVTEENVMSLIINGD